MTPYTALFKSGLLLENRGILLGKQYWCGFGKLMSENKHDRDDLRARMCLPTEALRAETPVWVTATLQGKGSLGTQMSE